MAFTRSNLALMAYDANHQWWSYQTLDAAAVVDTAGYFNEVAGELGVGDLIRVNTVDALPTPGSLTTSGWHQVLSNDGTTVDVSDAEVIAVTDTD